MKNIFIITVIFGLLSLSSCSKVEQEKVPGKEGAIKHLTEKCQNNESEFKLSGLSREKYNSFCSCYWKILVTEYPPSENEYYKNNGKNSPLLDKLQLRALKKCKSAS